MDILRSFAMEGVLSNAKYDTEKGKPRIVIKIDKLVENFLMVTIFLSPDENSNLFCEVLICWEHGGMKRKILICIP